MGKDSQDKGKGKGNRPGGTPGIGGLADAFVKAGLASEKDVDRARNQKRRENKELGAEGIAKREGDRGKRFEQSQREAAEASRELAAAGSTEAAAERAQRAIREHCDTSRGRQRWYFIARDGRVPYLDISDGLGRALADGTAGIVESMGVNDGEHVVVANTQALALLREHDAELVRFWNN